MMSTFPGSPRVQKGALIGADPLNPLASVIIFQYNPEALTRTLVPQTAGGNSPGEALRFKGPPQETIKLDAELDAADQLEKGDPNAIQLGLHPALAALELLLYPKSAVAIANEVLLAAGIIEVLPMEAPLTLFVWGPKRVVPVRVTDFSITEEAFDPNLNPIRAKVSLGLRVLNYQDLGLLSPGGALFMTHQIAKEVMATLNSVGSVASLF
jgi:hypothetical protein